MSTVTVPVIEGATPSVHYLFGSPDAVLRLHERRPGSQLTEHHYEPDSEGGVARESWILALYWTEDGVHCTAAGPRTFAPTWQPLERAVGL
jgi:hypothetical protein